jgi:hypothetical protein
MNTQHTTGPWKATHALGDQGIARHIWSATDGVTSHRELVAMIPDVDGDREHINADANVIAAAPEMLAALHEVIALLNDSDAEGSDALRVERQILEVIAKATGGAK